jgi:hypothetical protein
VFGFIIALIVAGYKRLSSRFNKKEEEQDAIKMGIQALLRNSIVENYNRYMEKGSIPIYALSSVEHLFSEYERLHGNGFVLGLMEKLRALPTQLKK